MTEVLESSERTAQNAKMVELSALGPFDVPPEDIASTKQKQTILSDLEKNYVDRFGNSGEDRVMEERAMVVGRFQPLQPGHTLLIEAAALVAKKVVVVIGSANIIDEKNPFPPEDRQYMLENMLEKKGLLDRVEFVYQDDVFDNFKWGQETLQKAQKGGEIDVVISNHESEWINGILLSRGKKVYEVDTLQRDTYRSTNIRKRLRKGLRSVLKKNGLHRIKRAKRG